MEIREPPVRRVYYSPSARQRGRGWARGLLWHWRRPLSQRRRNRAPETAFKEACWTAERWNRSPPTPPEPRGRIAAHCEAPVNAMAKMVTDDLPAGEDDNPNMMVQALGPSKSFGSKSLGEGDKTGVQVRIRFAHPSHPPTKRSQLRPFADARTHSLSLSIYQSTTVPVSRSPCTSSRTRSPCPRAARGTSWEASSPSPGPSTRAT